MIIVSWNLNGLQSCIDHNSFDSFYEILPDIICTQEIRTKKQFTVIDGYYHYWNPSNRGGYSGVLTMSLKEPVNVIKDMRNSTFDSEGRLLTLEFENCVVVNTYAPNPEHNLERKGYRLEWDYAYRSFLRQFRKPVIACGDFNVPRLDIDVYPENLRMLQDGYATDERSNMETLLRAGYVDAFRYFHPSDISYTWWSNRFGKRELNQGWRLDYFLISKAIKNRIKDVRHLREIQGSDHCPILLEVSDE